MDEEPRDYTHDEIIAKIQWLYTKISESEKSADEELKKYQTVEYDLLSHDAQCEHQFNSGIKCQLNWILETIYETFERFIVTRDY